mgnify:CR=1 FL=1
MSAKSQLAGASKPGRGVSRRNLLAAAAVSPMAARAVQSGGPAEIKGRLPQAKIGNLSISRMIIGGNQMGGWAHSRDLAYVAQLCKAYFTRKKVFDTLALAEQCGINAFLTSNLLIPLVEGYRHEAGGKIQFISDNGSGPLLDAIRQSIDAGAASCYIQGGVADNLVRKGDFDQMNRALELIRKNRMPAGIGAHRVETVKACLQKGLHPDYWMKTLHRVDYWSAKIEPENDNIWDVRPDETIALMRELKEPWIAFKVLAAGAIPPKSGFRFAFENGADFICVGMFDWQIAADVNLVLDVLGSLTSRLRPWCA